MGAGGTQGGTIRFFLGLGMLLGGGYLFLHSIRVISPWSWGYGLYGFGGVSLTSGMLMIPFGLGIGFIFYNSRNPLGWILGLGSLLALILGVLVSVRFSLRGMSAFELIAILVLMAGGLGILLSSLRDFSRR